MADQIRPWYIEETQDPSQSGPSNLPFGYSIEGSSDPYGISANGGVDFVVPFYNGTLSGNVTGGLYKQGKDIGGNLSGYGLQYNTDDYSLGGEYFNNGEYTGQGFMGRGTIRYADGGEVLDEKRFFTPRIDAVTEQPRTGDFLKPIFGGHNPLAETYDLVAPAFNTQSDRPMRYRVLDTLGAAANLPVRMATLGEYNTVDLLKGLTGKDFPAVRESEQRFYENNQPLMRPIQALGEALPLGIKGLGYAPVLRPPLPNKEAVKDAMLRLAANEEGSVPLGKAVQKELPLNEDLPSLRKVNQTPFYGEDVGPKGRISDPLSQVERLKLQGGLPEAPTDVGFFNPASSALLQEGVQPKQTVTYYKKQLGSRGGKLPPGQWEEITKGLAPDDVVERDWLVKQIDENTPKVTSKTYRRQEDLAKFERPLRDISDAAKYQNYATELPATDYMERVIGYSAFKKPYELKPDAEAISKIQDSWDNIVKEKREIQDYLDKNQDKRGTKEIKDKIDRFEYLSKSLDDLHESAIKDTFSRQKGIENYEDTHFNHPNIEGWYRSQDLGPGRILEEVQPQRQEKHRTYGAKLPQAQITKLWEEFNSKKTKKETIEDEIDNRIQEQFPHENSIASKIFYRDWDKQIGESSLSFERQNQIDNKIMDLAGEQAVKKTASGNGRIDYVFEDGSLLQMTPNYGRGDVSWSVLYPEQFQKILRAREANPELQKLTNEVNDLQSKLTAHTKGVPPSPYSHDVNAATDFLVKNALRDLSGNRQKDFSFVSWTPGEVQNARYDLSNKIGEITARPTPDKKIHLDVLSQDGGTVINNGIYEPNQLDDIVGKELAKKIRSEIKYPDKPGSQGTPVSLTGLDLEVGGEGMKKYYGSGDLGEGGILPERLKSIIKRVTGEKPIVQKQDLRDLYPMIRTDLLAGYKYKGKIFKTEKDFGKELGLTDEESKLIREVLIDQANYKDDYVMKKRETNDKYDKIANKLEQIIESGDLKPAFDQIYPRIDLPNKFKEKVNKIGLPIYAHGGTVSDDENLPRLRPLN